ncbi:MAG: hypothetical protein RLZZ239_704 [Pseudomonadota bacterium]
MIEAAGAQQLAGRANPIYLEGKLLPLAAPTAAELNLRNGQIIEAAVRLRDGQAFLHLKGQNLELPANTAWRDAHNLMVRAQQNAGGAWALQLLPPNTLPAPVSSGISRLAALLFRPPAQGELAQLFKPGTLEVLAQQLNRPDLAQQWRAMQLSMATISPQVLSQAVAANMGAEVWLARGLPPPPDDPRQLLRRLIQAMKQADTNGSLDEIELDTPLSRLVSGLDSLESHRIQAAQAQAQSEVLLHLTLPFADAEPAELVFRRPPRQPGQDMPWTVNVHASSQDLGPVWLRTQLFQKEQVEMTMWAVQQDVVTQAKAKAPELSALLSDAGLNMRSFQVFQGQRPALPSDWVPSGRGMVVDVVA